MTAEYILKARQGTTNKKDEGNEKNYDKYYF